MNKSCAKLPGPALGGWEALLPLEVLPPPAAEKRKFCRTVQDHANL